MTRNLPTMVVVVALLFAVSSAAMPSSSTPRRPPPRPPTAAPSASARSHRPLSASSSVCQPKKTTPSILKPGWTMGSSRKFSVDKSSFALPLSRTPHGTACFASITPIRRKSRKHMRKDSIHILPMQQHQKGGMSCSSRTLVMGLFKSNQQRDHGDRGLPGNENQLSNEADQSGPGSGGSRNSQLLLIPLLMYLAVPFLPSFLLAALNDDYLLLKRRFDAASAALPAAVPTDSLEYLSASALYSDTMRKLFVLLLSKRLALYFLATCATTYAGWRASMDVAAIRHGGVVSGPGDALDRLNDEILSGEDFLVPDSRDEAGASEREKKKDDDSLFATLVDDNPEAANIGNAVAVALPVALAVSLGVSYLAITLSGASSGVDATSPVVVPALVTASLPYLTSLPSAVLCLYFVATEFRWALPRPEPTGTTANDSPSRAKLLGTGNFLALVYVAGAYYAKIHPTLALSESLMLDLWPLQNGVNIALATTVARALSPFLLPATPSSKSLRTVALALVGLALFDAVFTFGTVANAATVAEPSMSVMETVARAKLAAADPSPDAGVSPLAYLWQPGLLEIILGHGSAQATEALGLGDVVFPSVLVAWGFAADCDAGALSAGAAAAPGGGGTAEDDGATVVPPGGPQDYPYATASVAGYVLGSFATEIVGSFSLLGNVAGLPALVFLVPSMLGAVTMTAWSRNELQDVWGTADAGDGSGSSF